MKVTAILKGRVDQNGQLPIQIRVNAGDSRTYHPTGLKVAKTQFQKGRVKDHPKAIQYNDEIKRLIIQHQAKNINGLQKKAPKVDFYEYLQQCIDKMEVDNKPGTIRIYKSLLSLLQQFRPRLFLHEIDKPFLSAWKKHRLAEVENNTVWSNLTKLRAIVRKAHSEGLMSDYPFKGWTEFPKYQETDKVFLLKEEVDMFEAILPEVGGLAFYGYWFLIACHTGFRVSDLLAFNVKKHIVNGRIIVTTQKTRDIVSIPFSPKIKGYFEKVEYRTLSCAAETYRGKVKAIALAAGIKKNISTHTARHTAAVLMATAGLSQEVVGKILGQKDLRSTRIYFKIINKKVDTDFDTFMQSMS